MFKESAIVNVIFSLGPILIGLFLAILIPNVARHPEFFIYTSWLLYGAGFMLFLIAKLPIIKSGKFFTFGPWQMTRKNRIFYKSGYVLMIIAFIFTTGLLLASKI